jgi:hypothetical protein
MSAAASVPILHAALLAWFGAVVAIVGYRLLTGAISLSGLLDADGVATSAERVQLLVGTLFALGAYVATALHDAAQQGAGLTKLPEVPDALLVLFGGNQALYLGAKFIRDVGNSRTP